MKDAKDTMEQAVLGASRLLVRLRMSAVLKMSRFLTMTKTPRVPWIQHQPRPWAFRQLGIHNRRPANVKRINKSDQPKGYVTIFFMQWVECRMQ
jgi:hypothetical protein